MSVHVTIGGHFCGQQQPHAAHTWQTPPVYGTSTYPAAHQCAGLSVTCNHHLDNPTGLACTRELGHADGCVYESGSYVDDRHADGGHG
jgi:hypothetical protein